MSRLAEDHEKLTEAVKIFRVRANLHGSSSDAALVAWAHGNGSRKPCADMVRTAWHDFAAGRHYADLHVIEYVIEYTGDPGEDPPPPTDQDSRDDGPAPTTDDGGNRNGEATVGSSSVTSELAPAALNEPPPKKKTASRKPRKPEPPDEEDVLF